MLPAWFGVGFELHLLHRTLVQPRVLSDVERVKVKAERLHLAHQRIEEEAH